MYDLIVKSVIWIVGCMIWSLRRSLLRFGCRPFFNLVVWKRSSFCYRWSGCHKILIFFCINVLFLALFRLLVWFINSKHVNGGVFCHLNGSYDMRSGFRVSFVWLRLLSRLGSDIIELDIKGTGKFTRDVVLECITLCLALFVPGPLYVKLQ